MKSFARHSRGLSYFEHLACSYSAQRHSPDVRDPSRSGFVTAQNPGARLSHRPYISPKEVCDPTWVRRT